MIDLPPQPPPGHQYFLPNVGRPAPVPQPEACINAWGCEYMKQISARTYQTFDKGFLYTLYLQGHVRIGGVPYVFWDEGEVLSLDLLPYPGDRDAYVVLWMDDHWCWLSWKA